MSCAVMFRRTAFGLLVVGARQPVFVAVGQFEGRRGELDVGRRPAEVLRTTVTGQRWCLKTGAEIALMSWHIAPPVLLSQILGCLRLAISSVI